MEPDRDRDSQAPLLEANRSSPGPGTPRASSRPGGGAGSVPRTMRQWSRSTLDSKRKHVVIMSLVALDVAALLAVIFIELMACEYGEKGEPWFGRTMETLHLLSLVISALFVVELALSVVAFGSSFFSSWFHWFDAAVILASFIVDIATHGIGQELASLVIVLRLWRLVKIAEEVSVGVAESREDQGRRIEELERDLSRRQPERDAAGSRGGACWLEERAAGLEARERELSREKQAVAALRRELEERLQRLPGGE